MFDSNVHITEQKNDIVSFQGWFGFNLKRELRSRVLSSNRIVALFIKITPMNLEVYSFFLLELKHVLEYYLQSGSTYGVNAKALENIIKYIDDYYLNSENNNILDYSRIDREMKFKILPHQQKAFDGYVEMKNKLNYRGYLGDFSVGSGKTFMSLAITLALGVEKVLIVVPNHTVDKVWLHALESEIFKEPQQVYSKHDIARNKPYNGEKYIVINYESLEKVYKFIEELGSNIAVIVDESHNFITLKSKRTEILVDIINKTGTDDVLLMSGTPIKGKVSELVPILQMLDKKFNKTIQKRFEKFYRGGGIASDILQARYKLYTKVITKDSLKLPPLETIPVLVKIDNSKEYTLETINKNMLAFVKERTKQLEDNFHTYRDTYFRLYNKYKEQCLLNNTIGKEEFLEYEHKIKVIRDHYQRNSLMQIPEVIVEANKFEKRLIGVMDSMDKKLFRDVKSIYKYLSLKVNGEALANVVMKARSDCYRDMVSGIDFDSLISSTIKDTVIFTSYLEVAEATYEKLREAKYTPARVYGEHTKFTKQTITEFINNKKVNPLIATFKSMSTGVTTVNANVVLMLNKPFRSVDFTQASARVHRIGQDLPCYVYVFSLDTGDKKNITDRDTDIIEYFKNEIGRITGMKQTVDVTGNSTVEDVVSVEDIFNSNWSMEEMVKELNIEIPTNEFLEW